MIVKKKKLFEITKAVDNSNIINNITPVSVPTISRIRLTNEQKKEMEVINKILSFTPTFVS
jgi:hypothetical protein